MKKVQFFLCGIMVTLLLPLSAGAFEIGVRGYYWFPGLNGDISVEGKGVPGVMTNLEDDLGMDDDYYPVLEFFGGLGNHHFSFSYYRADYEGNKVLTRNIRFNGVAFNKGSSVSSNFKYNLYDFMYQYDLLDLENFLAGFSLGIVGKLKTVDGKIDLKSATGSADESFTAPIPMVGFNFHGGILLDILEARLLVTGIGYSGASVLDWLAEISYTPFPFLDIHGGYRFFAIDLEVSNVDMDYQTSGPYVAVTVSF